MDNFFPILAIETSGDLCSVAVAQDENVFIELNYLKKHIHSEKILSMIETVLGSSSIKIEELKAIAVSIGPGSFTGLRIGLSAVKGIAFGLNLPLIPVPSEQALAYQISRYLPDGTKFSVTINASSDDVYYSKFIKEKKIINSVEPLRLVEKSELSGLSKNELVFGNIEDNDIIKLNYILNASGIATWAYLFGKDLLTFDYDYLEPNYFKKFVVKGKS